MDIPPDLLREAMRNAKATTKRQAVLQALEEYNRRQRMAWLAEHLGTFEHFLEAARVLSA